MKGDMISRRALLKEMQASGRAAYLLVMDAPTVDAVEVVRCKDCKWLYSGYDQYCCTKHTGLALIKPSGEDFCSYGERRGEG